MKKYCTECGQATEYVSSAPKFCQGCGESLDILKKNKSKASIAKQKEDDEDDEGGEGDEDGSTAYVPNLSKLDVEIEPSKAQWISLKDAMGSAVFQDKFEREPPPAQSREEFLQKFKHEAGALRSKGLNE